ncbi:MAG TPA: FAD-dependent oxidoreductase, partial [Stellaceae bacterium]|nr:FAD-dependent oxidoreductase [Stellaceae bacterium]
MQADVVVLGAGMIGVSVATHLQKRGKQVVLLDRRPPGEEASFGNAGLVQREGVFPHPFPRSMAELRRIARNQSVDAYYHLSALPGLSWPLLQYWRNSEPERYAALARQYSTLIASCTTEHKKLADEAGSSDLLRPIGYLRAYDSPAVLEADLAKAELAREFGVNSAALDPAALAAAEPHLRTGYAGAIHWTDPYSCSDPHALTLSYAALFKRLGGHFVIGEAATLQRQG